MSAVFDPAFPIITVASVRYGGTEVTCVCFYLTRAHDILSAHTLLSRAHELLSRAHELLSLAHKLLCRAHKLLSRAHKLLSRANNI